MKRMWILGLAGTMALAGWIAPRVAVAADEKQAEDRKPRRPFEVRRMIGGGGQLGVSLEDVKAEDVSRLGLATERGAVVTDVHEGSAAEKAGIREGDVIVRFAGEDVRSAAQLARLVRETPAGRTVDLEVSRGGSAQRLQATLARPERNRLFSFGPGGEDFHFEVPDIPEIADLPELGDLPAPPDAPLPPRAPRFLLGHGRKLGVSYQELGDQLARYFKVDGGVLVTSVEPDGPAAKAGIKAGDVIVRVGGKTVKDGGDLREAIRDGAAGSTTTVGIHREGRSMDLPVTLGEGGRLAPAPMRRRGART